MLTFAYKVGGWVWQNAYVITRITKEGQMDSGENLTTYDIYLIHFSHCNFLQDYLFSDDSLHFCFKSRFFYNRKNYAFHARIFFWVKYSKALRCTFFGEWKNSCSSNSCNFCYLIGWKARWSKNRASQGFYYINSFSSNIFGPNSKTCNLRPCISRPNCTLISSKKLGGNKITSNTIPIFLPKEFKKEAVVLENFVWG